MTSREVLGLIFGIFFVASSFGVFGFNTTKRFLTKNRGTNSKLRTSYEKNAFSMERKHQTH